jgi:hypothetical protein
VINPYGVYCDLPEGALFRVLDDRGKYIAAFTVDRPSQAKQGEPAFFHPVTNSRTIYRNNGDIDIDTIDEDKGTTGSVNINCKNANITATSQVTSTAPLTKVVGDFEVTGNTQVGGDFNNDGVATLGGAGGAAIARVGDDVVAGKITTGSTKHKAT